MITKKQKNDQFHDEIKIRRNKNVHCVRAVNEKEIKSNILVKAFIHETEHEKKIEMRIWTENTVTVYLSPKKKKKNWYVKGTHFRSPLH